MRLAVAILLAMTLPASLARSDIGPVRVFGCQGASFTISCNAGAFESSSASMDFKISSSHGRKNSSTPATGHGSLCLAVPRQDMGCILQHQGAADSLPVLRLRLP